MIPSHLKIARTARTPAQMKKLSDAPSPPMLPARLRISHHRVSLPRSVTWTTPQILLTTTEPAPNIIPPQSNGIGAPLASHPNPTLNSLCPPSPGMYQQPAPLEPIPHPPRPLRTQDPRAELRNWMRAACLTITCAPHRGLEELLPKLEVSRGDESPSPHLLLTPPCLTTPRPSLCSNMARSLSSERKLRLSPPPHSPPHHLPLLCPRTLPSPQTRTPCPSYAKPWTSLRKMPDYTSQQLSMINTNPTPLFPALSFRSSKATTRTPRLSPMHPSDGQ